MFVFDNVRYLCPNIYVQIPPFVSAFGIHIQNAHSGQRYVRQKLQKVTLQVEETFQTMYRINH